MAGDRARVLVADDDVLLREGLSSLLTGSGFDVVGQSGEPEQLLAQARRHRPDFVIVDIRMPPPTRPRGSRRRR